MSRQPAAIRWSETALKAWRKIGSATVRQKIAAKVSDLASTDDPTQLGKPLVDELQGLFRISFGRYRILYKVESNGQLTIVVVMVGLRKQGDKIDVYEMAMRLRRQGKL